MDKIRITKSNTTIEMPRVRAIKVGGIAVTNEVEMASGKTVKEMKGFRTTITAEWDWLPAKTMTSLHTLLRLGGYFKVEYPDPAEGDSFGMFSIPPPESGVFKFNGTEPRWHGVTLNMTAQEVT